MKNKPITFDEQKSEYLKIDKNKRIDNDSKEDTIMNKMIIQLVVIGFIGMILLFFVFQLFTHRSDIEDEQVARAISFKLSEENNKLIQAVKDIETTVYTMTDSDETNRINQGTMAFIRKDKYGYENMGMSKFIWSRFAGTMDVEAGINRADHEAEVLTISQLVENLNLLTDPINDYEIDFKHLVTVIDLELTNVSSIEYEDEYYDYLFSWAGDLETFFIDMAKYSQNNPMLSEKDLYEYAKITIGSSEESYFSREDLLADIDGVNIAKLIKDKDLLLSEAINDYYSNGLFTSRYTMFIESFNGQDLFKEKVVGLMKDEIEEQYSGNSDFVSYYKNIVGLKQLMSLVTNQSNYVVSSEMKEAATNAFVDLVIENYNIEAFENQVANKY